MKALLVSLALGSITFTSATLTQPPTIVHHEQVITMKQACDTIAETHERVIGATREEITKLCANY